MTDRKDISPRHATRSSHARTESSGAHADASRRQQHVRTATSADRAVRKSSRSGTGAASGAYRRNSQGSLHAHAQRSDARRSGGQRQRQKATSSTQAYQPLAFEPAGQLLKQYSTALIVLAAFIILIIFGSICLSFCSSQSEQTSASNSSLSSETISDTPQSADAEAQVEASFYSGIADDAGLIDTALGKVPACDELAAFSLSDKDTPTLSQAQSSAIQSALDYYGFDTAFLLIDLQSGTGIGYDTQELFYGASSIKAWYAYYLATCVEDGGVSLDDTPWTAQMEYQPVNLSDWENPYCTGGLIENAVILSDNMAYESLRQTYDGQDFYDWVDYRFLNDIEYSERFWYPDFSVTDSVKMWLNLYGYLNTGTDTADWLKKLFNETEVSFIRDALDGTGAVTYTKAGWDSESGSSFYDCLADSGMVEIGGRTYVFAFMSRAGEADENDAEAEALISAIFDARDALV